MSGVFALVFLAVLAAALEFLDGNLVLLPKRVELLFNAEVLRAFGIAVEYARGEPQAEFERRVLPAYE